MIQAHFERLERRHRRRRARRRDRARRRSSEPDLLALYRTTDEAPSGRLERLHADHPSTPERIARIEAACVPVAA